MGAREQELEARLRTLEAALFESSPGIQLLCDLEGEVIARNAGARELGNAKNLAGLFDKPEELVTLRERNFLGADLAVLRLRDGRQVMIAATPVGIEDTRLWEVVLHDVTTLELVGEEQQIARQLAAVGRLGRQVSNEITSPLAVLLGCIELLQTLESLRPEVLQRHLAVMGVHARRIATVIQGLDALALRGRGPLTTVGVAELLETVLREHRELLQHLGLTLTVEPPDLCTTGQPIRLNQVLSALLLQLAGFLGQGAGLSIEASLREAEVVISFVGHASPRFIGARRRILEDWRSEGPGQDLRTAVALNILVAHSGRLQAAVGGPALELVLPHLAPAVTGRAGLRVLFVDDDVIIRETTQEMLKVLGHEARCVETAEDALEVLGNTSFDAVVTDLVLPGLSGMGLREEIARRWSGLEERVVIVSGARQAPPESVVFVRKPYTAAHLHRALERVCRAEEEEARG